jgi:hypothetical protein
MKGKQRKYRPSFTVGADRVKFFKKQKKKKPKSSLQHALSLRQPRAVCKQNNGAMALSPAAPKRL